MMMARERKSATSLRRGSAKKARPGRGQTGRSDRWPSDYGRREAQEKEDRPLGAGRMKTKLFKVLANVDEQGDRANVRQNTPPKGLRSKR
jgi:hypothetical protein